MLFYWCFHRARQHCFKSSNRLVSEVKTWAVLCCVSLVVKVMNEKQLLPLAPALFFFLLVPPICSVSERPSQCPLGLKVFDVGAHALETWWVQLPRPHALHS